MKGSNKLGRFIATAIALFLSLGIAMAQSLSVKGSVVDSQGQPVVGASVIEKGTNNGTMTDLDGLFALKVKNGASLEVSCIGYATQVVKASESVNVTLSVDTEFLNEVVVVGFGTQKKANLTGAVASIDASKALESRPIPDVGRGLQGMTPGLNVVVGSTEVGSDPIFRIRGQVGSAEGGASPLILLDNVEIPSIQLINPDDIESISVLKDAASAAIYGAKAAFGVILIQSKKGAKTETITATYSGNFAFQSMAKKYEMADVDGLHYTVEASERMGTFSPAGAFWHIDRAGWQAAVAWKAKYGKNGTNPIDVNDPLTYGRDWYVPSAYNTRKVGVRTYNPYDYITRDWAPLQNHNVSVSGRTGKTTFNIGLAYLGQKGLMKTTDYDQFSRYNANVRVSTQINNWLNIHSGLMYSRSEKDWAYTTSSGTTDAWLYLYRWGPTYPLVAKDENGNNLRTMAYETAVANKASNVTSFASVNLGTTLTPVKNWTIEFDYTYANNATTLTKPGTSFYAGNTWEAGLAVVDANGNPVTVANEWEEFNGMGSTLNKYALNCYRYTSSGSNPDHIYQDTYVSQRNTFNATTDYNLVIGNHSIRPMVGLNAVAYEQTGSWAQITKLLDYTNPQFNLATGTQTAGGGYDWSSTLGYFARLNYAYGDKYLVEANYRYDGTSKFTKAMRWRPFYSFSAGWKFSEEGFMQGAKDIITSGKLRASWGKVGDQSVSSSLYIPTMSRIEDTWIHSGAKDYFYTTPAAVASDITWQDIQTLDFGIDLTLVKEVGITFDWYQRSTLNMIVPAEGLGYGFGTSAPKGNYGDLKTTGFEIEANWHHLFGNGLSLGLTGTLADATTKITNYGTGKIVSNWYNGKTYGEIWGYRVDGLYQNDDFVWENGELVTETYTSPNGGTYTINKLADPNAPKQGYLSSQTGTKGFAPGDMKYKDLNGDGVIDSGDNTTENHGDLDVIGNSTPRYEYSFRVELGYKNFDFSMFWQGIGKRELVGTGQLACPGFNSSDGCMPQTFAGDFWYETKDSEGNVIDANYDAFYPRALNGGSGTTFNTIANDRLLLNMAYLRLKNLTFGYTLPQNLVKKANIRKLRAYVSLENFLTFDHLNGLPIDPEVVNGYGYESFSKSNYGLGRTSVGTPAMKSASLGVQITF